MYNITGSLVLYRTPPEVVEKVVACFFAGAPRLSRKLFLVDNSPGWHDYTTIIHQYSEAEYIRSPGNIGYGSAHNMALDRASGLTMYHCILNNDVYFPDNVLEGLYLFMEENRDIIDCMPRIEYPDGQTQYLCKLLPTPSDLFLRRFFRRLQSKSIAGKRYELRFTGYRSVMDVPCLSGCFMFLRMESLIRYSLRFDEKFFMYLEDFDFIRRCHRVGRTVFNPEFTVVHDHARASYSNWRMLTVHLSSAIKYFNKYGWFFDSERRKINQVALEKLGWNKNELKDKLGG